MTGNEDRYFIRVRKIYGIRDSIGHDDAVVGLLERDGDGMWYVSLHIEGLSHVLGQWHLAGCAGTIDKIFRRVLHINKPQKFYKTEIEAIEDNLEYFL